MGIREFASRPFAGLMKAESADDHWVTIKQGHLKGRKILLDSKGYIVGGSVPEAFQGHHIGKLKGIGTDANPYTDFTHHELRAIHKDFKEAHESNKRELHEMRHDMAQQLHAAHLDQYGSPSSIASRIKQIGGIKAPARGKDAYAEEYLESVPASMRRVVGSSSGVAIDEAADELGMSASELIDALSSTEHKGRLSANHFYPEADRMLDHLHGEKHMQSKRDSVREMEQELAKVAAAMRRVKREKSTTSQPKRASNPFDREPEGGWTESDRVPEHLQSADSAARHILRGGKDVSRSSAGENSRKERGHPNKHHEYVVDRTVHGIEDLHIRLGESYLLSNGGKEKSEVRVTSISHAKNKIGVSFGNSKKVSMWVNPGQLYPVGSVKKSMHTPHWSQVKRDKHDEYGTETYADPAHDSYPLTKDGKPSRERTMAAWRYIHEAHDGDEYSDVRRAAIEATIARFAKKHFGEELHKSGGIRQAAQDMRTQGIYGLAKAKKAHRFAYKTDERDPIFIPVNRIKTPYQSEEATDPDKVAQNIKKIKDGISMPPLIMGYDHDLHDGHHRLEAAKACGHTHVPCVVGGMNEGRVQAAEKRYRAMWKSQRNDLASYLRSLRG